MRRLYLFHKAIARLKCKKKNKNTQAKYWRWWLEIPEFYIYLPFFLFQGNNIHCTWLVLASGKITLYEKVVIHCDYYAYVSLSHRMMRPQLSRWLISYRVLEMHGVQSLMDFRRPQEADIIYGSMFIWVRLLLIRWHPGGVFTESALDCLTSRRDLLTRAACFANVCSVRWVMNGLNRLKPGTDGYLLPRLENIESFPVCGNFKILNSHFSYTYQFS